jgi:GNAT superfamily N-acetyltransferase
MTTPAGVWGQARWSTHRHLWSAEQVGSLLVQHFLAWARERGARQASVTAYAANQAAQRFYERHGFAPASITSRAPL